MAALVDQQRILHAYKSKKPAIPIRSQIPVVRLTMLPTPMISSKPVKVESRPTRPSVISPKLNAYVTARKRLMPSSLLLPQSNGICDGEPELSSTSEEEVDKEEVCRHTKRNAKISDEDDDDDEDNAPLSSFIIPRLPKPVPTVSITPPASPQSLSPPTPPPDHPTTSPHSSPPSPHHVTITPPPLLCECSRLAVTDDPRWDGPYCSVECLVRVCSQTFHAWRTSENHQPSIVSPLSETL